MGESQNKQEEELMHPNHGKEKMRQVSFDCSVYISSMNSSISIILKKYAEYPVWFENAKFFVVFDSDIYFTKIGNYCAYMHTCIVYVYI